MLRNRKLADHHKFVLLIVQELQYYRFSYSINRLSLVINESQSKALRYR